MQDNTEAIRILNTAIIKNFEKRFEGPFDEKLKKVFESPAIEAINKSIAYLAETQQISRDQSAIQIIETVRQLDTIWRDYIMMEGIDHLKQLLNDQ